jgi:hypothetical protein
MRRLLALISILLLSGLAAAQDVEPHPRVWRLNHRLQAGWEMDSNVYEALLDPRSGQDLRLLYEINAAARGRVSACQLGYRGGGQFYAGLSRENKIIQEAETGGQISLGPSLQLGAQGWGRLKLFIRREDDYAFGRAQLYLSARLPASFSIKTGITGEGLNYARTLFYNYGAPGGFIQIQRRFGSCLILVAHANRSAMHYRRAAFTIATQNYDFPASGQLQNDRFTVCGIRLEGAWSAFIAQIGYRREDNRSNSFGYDYGRHVFEASFVKELAGLFLRGLITVQQKEYGDDLYPFWPLQLDTEREENNFIVLDLSRPVYDRVELLLRAAWYKNESPWANLYYKKSLFSLSLEYQF